MSEKDIARKMSEDLQKKIEAKITDILTNGEPVKWEDTSAKVEDILWSIEAVFPKPKLAYKPFVLRCHELYMFPLLRKPEPLILVTV